MAITNRAQTTAAYRFTVRHTADNGLSHGVFTKNVDAKSPNEAWNAVIKELKASKILDSVVSIAKG